MAHVVRRRRKNPVKTMTNNLLIILDKILDSALLYDDTSYIVYSPGSQHVDSNGVIRYNDPSAYQLAVEAAKNGEDHFHAKRGADGLLRKCEPQPYYAVTLRLTPLEYADLREARSSLDNRDHSSPQSWRPHVNLNEED